MNRYRVDIDESELHLLGCLANPIIGYTADGVADDFPTSVYLSLQKDQLKFTSKGEDLENHFECFGFRVGRLDEQKSTTNSTSEWGKGNNRVELMIRREALYEESDAEDNTLGNNPSMQKVITPGGDCTDASAICDVTAGVCITNLTGEKLVIYADTFPFCVRIDIDQINISKVLHNFQLLTIDEYRQRT